MSSQETNGDRPTPPHGIGPTLKVVAGKIEQHDSDISGLRAAVQTVANEVHELRDEVAEVKGIGMRLERNVGDLTSDLRRATIPPPRAELASGMDLRAFADMVKNAALDGEKRPDTTPDEQVAIVVERMDLIKRGKLFNKLLWLVAAGVIGWIGHTLAEMLHR